MTFDVEIEKLVYGGEGLARHQGQVVLVPLVVPGEKVAVTPLGSRGGVLRAKLAGDPPAGAEGRAMPECPYFGRCGGCHYQHIRYDVQLAAKRAILEETLRRVGKVEPPGEIEIVSGGPWGYRNRAQFHLNAGRIGYLEAHSHKLCPVERCPISSPRINETLQILSEMVRDRRWPGFLQSLELFTNETEVVMNVLEATRPVARRFFEWCAGRIPGFSGSLDYPAGELLYRVGSRSFFQVNRFLLDDLLGAAIRNVEGERAIDLYSGVGLFALPLSRSFLSVTAVEACKGAARDLRFNAERAAPALDVVESSVEPFLAAYAGPPPDFVLADPPRAGLGKDVVARLIALQARQIRIVACDPATLARDLAGLIAGGYRLNRMVMIDLFPQTFHIEAIAYLQRVE
ncbi:MAG: class I SAM-dependent RNA methyltransferase [Bryobacteraceae bacterium]